MQARQATKRSSIEEKLKVEKDAAKRILLKRRAAKAAQIEAAREERKSRQTEFKKQQEKEAVRIRQHAAAVKRDREAQLKKRREREAAARARSQADYQATIASDVSLLPCSRLRISVCPLTMPPIFLAIRFPSGA